MTTIYVPQVIETVEQAEALPEGTLATRKGTGIYGWTEGAVRVDYGGGWHIAGDEMSTAPEFMVGWTALVPVEAEEEKDDEWADYGGVSMSRLVTPWELA